MLLLRSRPTVISLALVVVASVASAAASAPAIAQDGVPATTQPAQPKPFIWPTTGRITQPYGCTGFYAEPSYGSCRHFHGAIDIADKQGTPIHAAADGVITHVGWDPWGTRAWMVMINHGGGLSTWYAHLRGKDIAGIDVGVRVHQGEVIGYMSDTGMATGVHLHWAVLQDGRYVNPRRYVEGKPFRPRPGRSNGAASCNDVWIAAAPGVATPGAATAMALPGDGSKSSDASCAA